MTTTAEKEASVDETTSDNVAVATERLEADICRLAGHLAAATCQFIDLIGEYDAREAWASWDMRSCAQWLSWKAQLSPGTAREHVRVARALRTLPVIHAEFAAGRMSYSKVRELTRIATPATDADLAEITGPMTAGQTERFTRAHQRCTHADDEPEPDPVSTLRWRQDHDTRLLHLTARLTPADAAVVLQALRAATGDLDHPHDRPRHGNDPAGTGPAGPDPAGTGLAGGQPPPKLEVPVADLAAALTELAASYLRGKITTADNADLYHVIIHTTPHTLTATPSPGVPAGTPAPHDGDVPAGTPAPAGRLPAGHPAWPGRCHLDDGPALSPLDAQVLACHATVSAMLHDTAGEILTVGRRSRRASAAIRRAVRERDGNRCAFPGCGSRRVDLHHIQWWSMGGQTSAKNLIPVCEYHHMLIHRRRYIITRTRTGYTFTHPATGLTIGPPGQLPSPTGDISSIHDAAITPDTIQQAAGERLDLEFAIWVALNRGRPNWQTPKPNPEITTLAA